MQENILISLNILFTSLKSEIILCHVISVLRKHFLARNDWFYLGQHLDTKVNRSCVLKYHGALFNPSNSFQYGSISNEHQ